IAWGAEWRLRINEAITGTTFFIPVITPSYFRSQSCRDELLKFAREAKRLGLEQLLMPVYWVSVPELNDDSEYRTDEAVALIARFQWEDFREVRLEDEGSAAFRKAVARLATELAGRASRVAYLDVASPSDAEAVETDESGPGFVEFLVIAEDAMPKLGSVLEQLALQINQFAEMTEDATGPVADAVKSGSGAKIILQLTEALARRMSSPAEAIERLGHQYAATLAEIDPAIHAMLDIAGTNAERTQEDIDERADFLATMQSLAAQAETALTSLEDLIQAMEYPAKFSRSLRVPIRRIEKGLKGILDGRAIVEDWGRRAGEIKGTALPEHGSA
ncbi:MAG TPA: TIR domain-containing protein, partial [Candidatus Elarobacter sp.]